MVPADYVWLNRGNHEDRSQNQFYCRGKHGCWGFIEEIFFKYASIGVLCNKMYNWIEACFHMLPIATLINESVRVSLESWFWYRFSHHRHSAFFPSSLVFALDNTLLIPAVWMSGCLVAYPSLLCHAPQVLVIHGGLSRTPNVTIDQISSIMRFRQIPITKDSTYAEDHIFEDLMWSDPSVRG